MKETMTVSHLFQKVFVFLSLSLFSGFFFSSALRLHLALDLSRGEFGIYSVRLLSSGAPADT